MPVIRPPIIPPKQNIDTAMAHISVTRDLSTDDTSTFSLFEITLLIQFSISCNGIIRKKNHNLHGKIYFIAAKTMVIGFYCLQNILHTEDLCGTAVSLNSKKDTMILYDLDTLRYLQVFISTLFLLKVIDVEGRGHTVWISPYVKCIRRVCDTCFLFTSNKNHKRYFFSNPGNLSYLSHPLIIEPNITSIAARKRK